MILNCLALHLEGLKIAFKVDEKFAKKKAAIKYLVLANTYQLAK